MLTSRHGPATLKVFSGPTQANNAATIIRVEALYRVAQEGREGLEEASRQKGNSNRHLEEGHVERQPIGPDYDRVCLFGARAIKRTSLLI